MESDMSDCFDIVSVCQRPKVVTMTNYNVKSLKDSNFQQMARQCLTEQMKERFG